MKKEYVLYEDFGAVGDGVADDFLPIKAAHDYANDNGLPVKATAGKTYRIFDTFIDGEAKWVSVRTDTDWTGANFIIDDVEIKVDSTGRGGKPIFSIENDYQDFEITDRAVIDSLGVIGPGTEKINLGLGYPALITVFDENDRVYKRSGNGSGQYGRIKFEVIMLDEEGNVLTYDDRRKQIKAGEGKREAWTFFYPEITKIKVHRTDVKPITVKGGEFLTKAPQLCERDAYFLRGLHIKRPFTVVEGVKHYVTGEVTMREFANKEKMAPAYLAFFYSSSTCGVTFKKCVMTGRRKYGMGTYDFGADAVNGIWLIECIQSNFWLTYDEEGKIYPATEYSWDEKGKPIPHPTSPDAVYSMAMRPNETDVICWGIGGTNFSKNMEYEKCALSRFDAHCGLLHGKIIDSVINTVSIVGKGDFVIENTTNLNLGAAAHRNTFVYLRCDYGSPWDGTVTVRNSLSVADMEDADGYGVIFHRFLNKNVGFPCHFPNVVVDNLKVMQKIDENKNDLSESNLKPYELPVNLISKYSSFLKETNAAYDAMHLPVLADGSENENIIIAPEHITVKNSDMKYNYEQIGSKKFFENTKIRFSLKGKEGFDYEKN